jgi:hypothetical protein
MSRENVDGVPLAPIGPIVLGVAVLGLAAAGGIAMPRIGRTREG